MYVRHTPASVREIPSQVGGGLSWEHFAIMETVRDLDKRFTELRTGRQSGSIFRGFASQVSALTREGLGDATLGRD